MREQAGLRALNLDGTGSASVTQLEMNPTGANESQRSDRDNEPQEYALQERTPAWRRVFWLQGERDG